MDENMTKLAAFLRRHEGCSLTAYPDKGGWSIGYGHWGVGRWDRITQEDAERLFEADLHVAAVEARRVFGYLGLSGPRLMAWTAMAFQMGTERLQKFERTIAFLRAECWPEAALEALDSVWALKETPARAIETALLLWTGEWKDEKTC